MKLTRKEQLLIRQCAKDEASFVRLLGFLEQRGEEEEALLDRFRAIDILKAAPSSIVVCDARTDDHPVIYVNEAFQQDTGYTEKEVIGKNLRFLQGEDRQQPKLEIIRTALENTEPCQVTLRNYRKNGTLFWNELYITPVFDDAEEVEYYIGVQNDVTARRQAQAALQAQTKTQLDLYRNMVYSNDDGIALVDANYVYQAANDAYSGYLGVSRAELEGRPVAESIADQIFRQVTRPNIEKCLRGEVCHYSDWSNHPTKGRRFIHVTYSPYRDGQDEISGVVVNVRDMTELKQMEERLRVSEATFRALVENSADSIVRLDRDGVYLYANPATERLMGLPVAQIVGQNIAQIGMPRSVVASYQYVYERLNRTEQPQEIEISIDVDGQRHDFHLHLVPEFDQDGTFTTVLGTARNISKYKQMQQQEFDLKLERERRRFLAKFIEGAAHEFRTPLATIGTSAYMLMRMNDERRQTKVDQIQSEIQRIARLVDMLMLMAKLEAPAETEQRAVDIGYVLQTAVGELRPDCEQNRTVRLELPDYLPPVMGNEDDLVEAFAQILDNACRFTAPADTINIVARIASPLIQVDIVDNGPGISPENLPHIFESFWRRDKARTTPGFGLGLPIALEIVQRHGGRIDVESEVDVGSRFRVSLPAA